MYEFMKTSSTLQQNFFACLPAIAGRKASVVRLNPGGLASRRLAADSPGVWLPADPKRGSQELFPGGVGWVCREGHFPQLKCRFWLQDSPGQPVAWKLREFDRHKLA